MDFDNKTLAQYLVEVKRIEESRSKGADKEIRSLYKALLKNLNSFIGEYYTKYSNDEGILNVAILQQSAKYASFLEEVDKNIKEVTPAISKTIKSTVEKTYKACFEGMINGFSNSAGDSKFKDSFNGLSIKPEVLKAAVENPISGLTLPERLQKHRQDVIYDIRQSISNSLMTGERFDTTSKKLVERLDISYGKANRIVRTESHRVQEKGLLDGAEAIGDKVKDDGLIYAAIWRNIGDEKVRPNVRVHTSKGWKTYKSKTKANHIKMEGQVVEVGGHFDLGNGVKAKSPGESGTPENDCNCRCYLDYEMMTVEEFKERGGRWKNEGKVQQKLETEKAVGEKFASAGNDIGNISEKADKSFTNDDESGIIELEQQRYGRNKNTIINNTYIDGGEYKRKFDNITDNPKVNKNLYDCAKKALKHRSGTELEDMYWFDGITGKVVAQEINSTKQRKIVYSKNTRKAVKNNSNLITLHTHPSSMPPSIADFNSSYRNQYKLGIIACHNGKIFAYKSYEEVNERVYGMYIGYAISGGKSEYDAQIEALNKLKENFEIDFWEVN
jgi:hypothetical protein|nr:MAG TPA_asm: minor capsid protein [Caudoviricetes sp.]